MQEYYFSVMLYNMYCLLIRTYRPGPLRDSFFKKSEHLKFLKNSYIGFWTFLGKMAYFRDIKNKTGRTN